MTGQTWRQRRDEVLRRHAQGDPARTEYVNANATFVTEAINGRAAFSEPDPDAGAHAVANIASVHVPSFVEASRRGEQNAYKNGYDLGRYRVGDDEPLRPQSRRERVDAALPRPPGATPADVYFMAVELNGTGVRYYGDIALFLERQKVLDTTVILDRNSYELTRDPLATRIRNGPGLEEANRRREACALAGTWGNDLGDIATINAFGRLDGGTRQWTPGQISDALLVDEDYIEVLKVNSFSADDLREARIAADDAAHESLIADRCAGRPLPTFESLLWRHQRRNADEALRKAGVAVRVVVTSGRTRS